MCKHLALCMGLGPGVPEPDVSPWRDQRTMCQRGVQSLRLCDIDDILDQSEKHKSTDMGTLRVRRRLRGRGLAEGQKITHRGPTEHLQRIQRGRTEDPQSIRREFKEHSQRIYRGLTEVAKRTHTGFTEWPKASQTPHRDPTPVLVLRKEAGNRHRSILEPRCV